MESNLGTAIDKLRQKEESGLSYIYSKTYNYVYLRAKSLLKKESDMQQLMQNIYIKLLDASAEVTEENLYEWLGKKVYTDGCQLHRKKKAREAAFIEMDKNEIPSKKNTDLAHAVKAIHNSLEELPDLYQATFYAFYYDYMPVEEIAKVMDCTVGVIINRLNYTKKYIEKTLEVYQEEKNIKVAFSVETICIALKEWSAENCLGITAAQSVYNEICKQIGLKASSIYIEGKEFGGVNKTVVYHKNDDMEMLQMEFEKYAPKQPIDKKKIGIYVGGAVLILALVLGIALFATKDKGDASDKNNQVQNEQQEEEKEPVQEEEQEPTQNEEEQETVQNEEEQETTQNQEEQSSEYIFPDSDTRKLTRDELEALSKNQLRLARNEVFARHGMIFGVEDLDSYFKSKSWYQPSVAASEFYDKVEMNMIEEANVSLILEVEGIKE